MLLRQRLQSTKRTLLLWSGRSASSRWNLISLKKHHDCNSSATTRTHRSSAAPGLLHPTRLPMIDLPRSTYYYQPTQASTQLNDLELAELIGDIHDVFPGYGYRRITMELKARGHVINHKRVARVMRENALHAHHRRRFKPVAGSEQSRGIP